MAGEMFPGAASRNAVKTAKNATFSLGIPTRLGLALAGTLVMSSCAHPVKTAVVNQAKFVWRNGETPADNQGQASRHASSRNPAARSAVSSTMQRQIQNAIDAGEGDMEARNLRQRLAANADDLDARIRLARLYSSRGLPDLALEHYRLAVTRFPDSVAATLGLAKTLQEMDETERALDAIAEFVKRQPKGNWELLSFEGILEDQSGRTAQAEASHRAALALEPGKATLHNNLGFHLLGQGRAEEAAAEFRRAIEIDPRSEIAHNNLGVALASQSPSAQQEALIELQRSASPAAAHNNLAAVLIGQGRYAEARTELEAALRLRPDFPEALSNFKLVSDGDGQPITIPAAAPNVSFWKRAASTWSKVFAIAPSPKPGAPSTGQASGAATGKD